MRDSTAIPTSNYSLSTMDGWFVISFSRMPTKNAKPLNKRGEIALLFQPPTSTHYNSQLTTNGTPYFAHTHTHTRSFFRVANIVVAY